jgi:hypothetical protein
MNLNSKRLSFADVRPKIFTEMEVALEAEFLELLELRERLRRAELSADTQNKTRDRKPASCCRCSRLAYAASRLNSCTDWP